jgi:hypothetical protein
MKMKETSGAVDKKLLVNHIRKPPFGKLLLK